MAFFANNSSEQLGFGKIQTTPVSITPEIIAFSGELAAGQAPIYLSPPPSTKQNEAMLGECFDNVRQQIEQGGGEHQFGWIIWERTKILLEAEFHSVWRSPDGRLTDCTPQADGEDSILFLPDPATRFDFNSRQRIPNRRFALQDDHELARYLKMQDEWDSYGEAIPLHSRLLVDMNRLSAELMLRYSPKEQHPVAERILDMLDLDKPVSTVKRGEKIGRNDSCPCGSGKKYKKCCLV